MWDVRVCVACLATDVKMYSMSSNNLLQAYQLLAGVQFDEDNDYLPKKLCWECAALVNRFNLFRHKCERAYLLLQDIYNQHDEIMDYHIKETDRKNHHLSSPLSIIHMLSYIPKSRNIKKIMYTKREPVAAPVKHEFEVQLVKAEHDLVKYEPDSHFNEPSADSDCNEAADSDSNNLQEPDEEESLLEEPNVKQEEVKAVSLQELGWTEVPLTKERALEVYTQRKNSAKYNKAAYKCELCYRDFPFQVLYDSHMSRHDSSHGEYECDICKLRFNTLRNIRRHISCQHSKQYTCNLCHNNYFSKDTALRHYRQHQKLALALNARKRKSEQIRKLRLRKKKQKAKAARKPNDFEFVDRVLTQEQMMEVVRERQFTDAYKKAPFKCSLCFKVFLEVKTYKNHMRQHDPVCGDFECDICKVRVRTRLKVYVHISTLHARSYTCKICPVVSYSRAGAQDHQQWHKGVKYVCHVCGAQFSRNPALANHVHRKHPSVTASHICGECGTSFPSAAGLRNHKNFMHQVATAPEEKGPYCEECEVQFATTKAWTKHILNSEKHQDVKKSIANGCRHCGETFPSSSARRRHVSIEHPPHSNWSNTSAKMFQKGPLPCCLCGDMMDNRMQYWAHFRRAHPGEPYPLRTVSLHVCEQCGRGFKCEALLRLHRVVHSGTRPYQCSDCPKAFNRPESLRSHSATHSEEMPHKCDLCGRAFRFKGNMARHIRTHTGEKRYSCSVCAQAFTTRQWMLLHVRKVHNKEHIPTKPRIRKRKPPT